MPFHRVACVIALTAALLPAQTGTPDQRAFAHDLLRELIEINTTDSAGDITQAAEAMAAKFRAAGFPEADIRVLGAAPRKGNLVVRFHGTGGCRPILFGVSRASRWAGCQRGRALGMPGDRPRIPTSSRDFQVLGFRRQRKDPPGVVSAGARCTCRRAQ